VRVIEETMEDIGMNWPRVARGWRAHLVEKLQDRYGLPEDEAAEKAQAWLDWLAQQPRLKAQTMQPISMAEIGVRPIPPHPRSRVRPAVRPYSAT
jgi:hypothetical protein